MAEKCRSFGCEIRYREVFGSGKPEPTVVGLLSKFIDRLGHTRICNGVSVYRFGPLTFNQMTKGSIPLRPTKFGPMI